MAYTSKLGTVDSTMGLTSMVLGVPIADTAGVVTATSTLSLTQLGEAAALSIDRTGASSITFAGAADRSGSIFNRTGASAVSFTALARLDLSVSATSTISFTQTNAQAGTITVNADTFLVFSQTNAVTGPTEVGASQALTFTQAASSGLLSRTANNVFSPTSFMARFAEELSITAGNTLSMTQFSASGLLTRTSHDEFNLTQTNNRFTIKSTAVALTASDSITFTQVNSRGHVLASGTSLTTSDTLTFTDTAVFPIDLTVSHELTLVQSASGNTGKSGTSEFTLTQSVFRNWDRNISATSSLNLSHGFSAVKFRNGIAIGDDSCDATKTYSPFAGGDSPIIRPVAPALNRKTDVEFFSPVGPSCTATQSMILRTPNFGDRDRNQYTRINRESRGGSLTIFRDPKWPAIRSLVMDFSGVKDSEVDGVISFLEVTLGTEIAFRDWNSRVWYGLIVNPDSAITRTGVNRNDISLEMEVTDSALEVNGCNSVTFDQTASEVVV